jgi:integrase
MQYDAWTDTKRYDALSDSKKTAYKIAFKRLEPIHHMDIGDVRLEDLQPIVDSVATYYPARDVRQVLSHLFKPAVIDGRAAKNYAEYIDLPQTEKPQKDAFNLEEVNSLWGIYELDIFAGYILLMIYTGMALGELQNVKREYVDLDKHMIHNVGTKNELRKRTPIFVCSLIEPVLLALYEKSSDSERLLNHNEDVFYKKYYEVLESAKCRKLTPHCCRHTTATALAQADVHPAIIKTIMRHSKYQTTTEYTHIDADAMVKALDKILR